MTQLPVPPSEAESDEPMAQILWLHQGRWVDAPVVEPASSRSVSPPGWYADRLRYWDGADWTDEWRPIARPAPAMRLLDEDSVRSRPHPERAAEPPPARRPEDHAVEPIVVGLLGLPPALRAHADGAPSSGPTVGIDPHPTWTGLLGLPPSLVASPRAKRRGARLRP